MSERKTVTIKSGESIPFVAMTKKYGRAEFCFCPIYKRGVLKQIHITPIQQPHAKCNYLIDDVHSDSFQINGRTYDSVYPKIWLSFWCKEHKTQSFRCYVDENSKSFSVSKLSTLSIDFD